MPTCAAPPAKRPAESALAVDPMEYRVGKLTPRYGDVIVIKPTTRRPPEVLREAARKLQSVMPAGVTVLAIDADCELSVITPESPEYASAVAAAARAAEAGHAAQPSAKPHTEASEHGHG